jgi:prolipoprotein diacylglyceryltransferase
MLPTILQIGPIVISSLGVMVALGFFLASFLIWQRGKEEYFEENLLMDGILLVILVGLMSARLGYILLHGGQFDRLISCLDLIRKPGFSWQGALLGGIFTLIFYCRKRKWDFYKLADLSVFGVVLGLILAKIGLFLSQTYPEWIFLIEAVLLALIYQLLLVFDKNYRTYEWYKNKRGEVNPGFLFFSFLGLTSLLSLGVNIFQHWPKLFNSSAVIDFLIILGALIVFYFRSGDRHLTISWPYFKRKEGAKERFRFKTGREAKK